MNIIYFPDETAAKNAIKQDDPMLVLVSYDGETILLSSIDECFEHLILLRYLNYDDADIEKFFRVVVDSQRADWTFVCPTNYKGIQDRDTRIKAFQADGLEKITVALKSLGYSVEIKIPDRYKRTLN